MGIFDRRKPAEHPAPPPYKPAIDMSTARPAVFALAFAPSSNDAQVRTAIANVARLSGRPAPMQVMAMIRTYPDALQRPWFWLVAVMRQAGETGDYHLAAAALVWSIHWSSILVPRIGNNAPAYLDLELDPIPRHIKEEILALGMASLSHLPEDFVIVGDETGQMRAGPIAEIAASALGL
jgi:hypothetical protein